MWRSWHVTLTSKFGISATAASHYVALGLKKKQEYSVKLILIWIVMALKSFWIGVPGLGIFCATTQTPRVMLRS